MKAHQFFYVGEPIPNLMQKEYTDFLIALRKAVFTSLRKSGLLTGSEYERCMTEAGACELTECVKRSKRHELL